MKAPSSKVLLMQLVMVVMSADVTECKKSSSSHSHGPKDDRVYVFAFSSDGPPSNFVKKGVLMGQAVEMVKKICEVAGKKCDTAVVPRKHCWDSLGYPAISRALDGRWYDACANYPPSPQRLLGYFFPKVAYFNTLDPALVTRPGSNITLNNLTECNQLRLAFPGNTAVTPTCVLASSLWINESLMINIKAESDLVTVNNGIVDAILADQADVGIVITQYLVRNDVEVLTTLPCTSELALNLNIMMRKDDATFAGWWDDALEKFICKQTPKYLKFCRYLEQKYSSDPKCRLPGVDIDCDNLGSAGSGVSDFITERIEPCNISTTLPPTTLPMTTTEATTVPY